MLGHLLITRSLNKNLYPSWNFGPKNKKNKNVIQLVKEFFLAWGIKNNYKFLKLKKFKEAKLLILDSKKSQKELKWQTRLSFKETVRLTVEWYKNFLLKKDVEKFTISQIKYFLKK